VKMTEAAFANPAHDLARTFRPILDAMANPGRILPFAPELSPPAGLAREAAAVALTMCDFQSPVWLQEKLRTPAIEHYLRFHTGAPLTQSELDAMFVFADAGHGVPQLSLFSRGTHEYPDRSATIVIQTGQLRSDLGVTLKGPGIQTARRLGVGSLGTDFWQQMIASRADFPLGIDVIFVAPEAIAAVPRSTHIHLMEAV
jgi:alpha-D-ribose 1-methylphosphonate 5-triphosphate synthase subunit PhnH